MAATAVQDKDAAQRCVAASEKKDKAAAAAAAAKELAVLEEALKTQEQREVGRCGLTPG